MMSKYLFYISNNSNSPAISNSFYLTISEKPALGEKLESLQEALNNLPPAHYQTLKFLMAHLYR